MKNRLAITSARISVIRKERGVVLFVALIVMVAMAMAAIALMRSVDTGTLAAGNRALNQGALQATDLGIAKAKLKFDADAAPAGYLSVEKNTRDNHTDHCYFAKAFRLDYVDTKEADAIKKKHGLDTVGIPELLKLSGTDFEDAFPNCFIKNAATGENIYFLIDRQCTNDGAADPTTCIVYTKSAKGGTDNDLPTGAEADPLFRITVRVDGTHNTVSYSQVLTRTFKKP